MIKKPWKKILVFYGSSSEIWFDISPGFYSDQIAELLSHVSALRCRHTYPTI